MRVLTVLPDVSLPPDTGLHLRMLGNLALVRSLGHESYLLFFSTEERGGNLELIDEVCTAGRRPPSRRPLPLRALDCDRNGSAAQRQQVESRS